MTNSRTSLGLAVRMGDIGRGYGFHWSPMNSGRAFRRIQRARARHLRHTAVPFSAIAPHWQRRPWIPSRVRIKITSYRLMG